MPVGFVLLLKLGLLTVQSSGTLQGMGKLGGTGGLVVKCVSGSQTDEVSHGVWERGEPLSRKRDKGGTPGQERGVGILEGLPSQQ